MCYSTAKSDHSVSGEHSPSVCPIRGHSRTRSPKRHTGCTRRRIVTEVATRHQYPRHQGRPPPRGKGTVAEAPQQGRCRGGWDGTEDVPDCHSHVECFHDGANLPGVLSLCCACARCGDSPGPPRPAGAQALFWCVMELLHTGKIRTLFLFPVNACSHPQPQSPRRTPAAIRNPSHPGEPLQPSAAPGTPANPCSHPQKPEPPGERMETGAASRRPGNPWNTPKVTKTRKRTPPKPQKTQEGVESP